MRVQLFQPGRRSVADDLIGFEAMDGRDIGALNKVKEMCQARGLVAAQVNLSRVACHHQAGAAPNTGHRHPHFSNGHVLRVINDDERLVERPPTHVTERCDFELSLLNELVELLKPDKIAQDIFKEIELPVAFHLFTRCLSDDLAVSEDVRPGDDDVLYILKSQLIERCGNGNMGLSCAGGVSSFDRSVCMNAT